MSKGKVITIQGDESHWYKKVVFVMKDNLTNPCNSKNLKEEAEKIIGNYAKLNGLHTTKPPKSSKDIDNILNLTLWTCICVLGISLSICLL